MAAPVPAMVEQQSCMAALTPPAAALPAAARQWSTEWFPTVPVTVLPQRELW